MTDYFGVTDYFIVTNDIIVTHYSIYFRYRWLHNYRLLHSYRLQRFSVKMNGCNSKVICKNSSATVSKILFNIAILIIHYKLYSNGGFNIMGLGCESNLSLPWTPGVCENGKPIRVYQNGGGGFWKFYTGGTQIQWLGEWHCYIVTVQFTKPLNCLLPCRMVSGEHSCWQLPFTVHGHFSVLQELYQVNPGSRLCELHCTS